MEEKKFNFWNDHSTNFLQMAFDNERNERIEKPDGHARKTGDCGDTVEMFLMVKDGVIQRVSFLIEGCRNTFASANTVAVLVEGKPVDEAWRITPEDVIAYLETLPEENHHCAELAVGTLYLALANYQELKRHSWKKLFVT